MSFLKKTLRLHRAPERPAARRGGGRVKRPVEADRAGMKPGCGRAPGRRRVVDEMTRTRRRNLSVIGAVRATGGGERPAIEESVDASVFAADVTERLRPTLREGDAAVLDNPRVHHASDIERVASERKATVMRLPSHSPDFNPIARLRSKMKP
jgi:hypothetical protein